MPSFQTSGEGEASVFSEKSGAVVTNQSPAEEKIKLYRSLFRGREDVYAKRWHSEKSDKRVSARLSERMEDMALR